MNDIEYLVNSYFNNDKAFSKVTSSHWQKYGKLQKVTFKKPQAKILNVSKREVISETVSNIKLSGGGFGDYKKLTLGNLLINIPIFIYLIFNSWLKLRLKTFYTTLFYTIKSGQIFSYDVTRCALTIDYLEKNIGDLNSKTITIIGDGYGRLGCLIKLLFPESKIIYINLGRTLLFDYYYSFRVFPKLQHKLIKNFDNFATDFNYIEAEFYNKFKIKSDIFVNIASMQEMNLEQINDYFHLIKQNPNQIFYCCNRLSKKLPDESIINFLEYPWDGFEIIKDELCPWHQKFPSLKPPFIRKFDGPTQHRLAKS
jgi:hypothetical protein